MTDGPLTVDQLHGIAAELNTTATELLRAAEGMVNNIGDVGPSTPIEPDEDGDSLGVIITPPVWMTGETWQSCVVRLDAYSALLCAGMNG